MEKKLMFVKETVEKMGLNPKYVPTGRPYVIEGMKTENARIGYELSGHIFTSEWLDDGMKNILHLASIVQKTGKKVSELVDDACTAMPYNVGEVRFGFDNTKAMRAIRELGEPHNRIKNFKYTVENDLTITDGECTLYLRTSSHSDNATAIPFGPTKQRVDPFMDRALENADSEFRDALMKCYQETAQVRGKLFYSPQSK
jgi:phosphomannomutase